MKYCIIEKNRVDGQQMWIWLCLAVALAAIFIAAWDAWMRPDYQPTTITLSDAGTTAVQDTCPEWQQKKELADRIVAIRPMDRLEALSISAMIVDNADRYGIPARLVFSIAAVESAFDPRAYRKGDSGIMQVNQSWWADTLKAKGIIRDASDLFTVEKGVQAGCFILSELLKDRPVRHAVTAYNGLGKQNGYADRVFKVMGSI